MASESNKQIVRRFTDEFWNKRRLEMADELFAVDCVTHQLRSGQPEITAPRSPEHMREHAAGWLAAMPDLQFKIEQMLSEGDLVFTSTVMEGTHLGPWSGVPPTHKKVSIRLMVVHRLAGGKICEDWVLVESLGFLQQVGVAPPIDEMLAQATRNAQR
jgi:steroid delta-isomerase-like uncharacterized protein